jgi:type I restriction enzyme S subunit
MPEGWVATTLGALATINPDNTNGWPNDRRIRYVDLAAVSEEQGINLDAVREYAYGSAPGRARRVVRTGDVLVATVRPYLRGFGVVPDSLDGQVASTGFAVIRALPGAALSDFIWAVVRSDGFVEHLNARATGSNYPAVRPADVASFRCVLPPIGEQRRIADFIAAFDEVETRLMAEGERARKVQGGLAHLLISRGEYSHISVGEVTTVTQGWTIPKELQGQPEGEIPFFKIADTNRDANQVELVETENWVSLAQVVELKLRVWPPGTVVFPRVGATVLTEKRRILVRESLCDDNFLAAIPGPRVHANYLLAFFETVRFSDQVQRGSVPSLNQSHVKSLRIPLPDPEDQMVVAGLVDGARDIWRQSAIAASHVRSTRKAVLLDLLGGDRRIPATYDRLLDSVA